jgi:hypothetical protein
LGCDFATHGLGKVCKIKDVIDPILISSNNEPQNNAPQPSGRPPTCPDGSTPATDGTCTTSPTPNLQTQPLTTTCPDGSTPATGGTCPTSTPTVYNSQQRPTVDNSHHHKRHHGSGSDGSTTDNSQPSPQDNGQSQGNK